MSNVTTRATLTTEQLAANRTAIMNYIADSYVDNDYELGTCILLPEFTLDSATGEWVPAPNAIRSANNPNDPTAAYIRLGCLEIGDGGKPVARYTNTFMAQGDMALSLKLQKASAGKKFKGQLVIEESLTPFSTTNPARDAKMAGTIACVFTGTRMVEDELRTYTQAPIYRRTVHTTNMQKTDILIAHTNREAISEAARVRWNTNNKANSNGIKDAAAAKMTGTPTVDVVAIEARIDELEAIPPANRTRAQKKELTELEAKLATI